MAGAGGDKVMKAPAHRPPVSVHLPPAGEVLSVLAGPGLLDVRARPGVCGGLRGAGGLHRPEVLHSVCKHAASCRGRLARRHARACFITGSTCLTPTPPPEALTRGDEAVGRAGQGGGTVPCGPQF